MSIYRITEHGASVKEYGVKYCDGTDDEWYFLGYNGELHQEWNECNAVFESIERAEVFINQLESRKELTYNVVKEIRFE